MKPPQNVALLPEAPAALAEAVTSSGATVTSLEQADVLVWFSGDHVSLKEVLARAPGVRWVSLPSAGVEAWVEAGIFTPDRTWTCAKQVYGPVVAEHGVAMMLAAAKDFKHLLALRTWGPQTGRYIEGQRALFLGGGGITTEMIKRLEPFGIEATVVRRRPDPVPGARSTITHAELGDAIPDHDWVVVAWALTPETEDFVDAGFLSQMKSTAWLVNLARGRHVVTDDLVEALRAGRIGGACLDVTDPEPLPDGHPLWEMDNCIITPHSANTWQMGLGLLAQRLAENLRRDRAGEPLLGLVDPALGY